MRPDVVSRIEKEHADVQQRMGGRGRRELGRLCNKTAINKCDDMSLQIGFLHQFVTTP